MAENLQYDPAVDKTAAAHYQAHKQLWGNHVQAQVLESKEHWAIGLAEAGIIGKTALQFVTGIPVERLPEVEMTEVTGQSPEYGFHTAERANEALQGHLAEAGAFYAEQSEALQSNALIEDALLHGGAGVSLAHEAPPAPALVAAVPPAEQPAR